LRFSGYEGVKIEKFGKDFHDGLALCAIIHKHNPKLINYASLKKDAWKENLTLAMDAANKYFDLEKYLTPDDIVKLDENSMVIYVSEYVSSSFSLFSLDHSNLIVFIFFSLFQSIMALPKPENSIWPLEESEKSSN
jgi:hypothetical protein